MAWLVRHTKVLASVEIADTFRTRLFGLLGRRGIDGALLLRPARSVHTIGMRFPIDVAFCDGDLRVLRVRSLKPWRVAPPVRRACVIIEAERGAFERWGLAVGDELAVHGDDVLRHLDGGAANGASRLAAAARARLGRRTEREEHLRATAPVATAERGEATDRADRRERRERPVLT